MKKITTREMAGKILKLLYHLEFDEEIDGISSEILEKKSRLGKIKIRNALRYLERKGLITGKRMIGGNWIDIKLTGEGITTVEDEDKYKRYFEVNVGFFKWGVTER